MRGTLLLSLAGLGVFNWWLGYTSLGRNLLVDQELVDVPAARLCERWVVFRFESNLEALDKALGLQDWCLVAVGNTHLIQGRRGVRTVDEWMSEQGPDVENLLEGNATSKNLGYLYAMSQGAQIVLELDDSVSLLHSLHEPIVTRSPFPRNRESLVPNDVMVQYLKNASEVDEFFNPLDYILKRGSSFGTLATSAIGVIQLLPGLNADTTRLLAPPQSYAPYSSLGTLHMRSAFWGLFSPSSFPDAWRSFVAETIFRDFNLTVLYQPYDMTLSDGAVSWLSTKSRRSLDDLLSSLREWSSSETSLPSRLANLWEHLHVGGLISDTEMDALRAWISMLDRVGFEYPVANNFDLVPQAAMEEQPVRVGPSFNLGGPRNETYAALLQRMESRGDWSKWKKWRGGALDRSRERSIVKLLLMTKDEWPLIRDWTLYHGELLGFEHLYIIDGSDDERCTSFLRQARDEFGVNVIFSDANLNELESMLTSLGRSLAASSDFLIKMDTDEFLAGADEDCSFANPSACRLSPYAVADYLSPSSDLRSLADGRQLAIGFLAKSRASLSLCASSSEPDLGAFSFTDTELGDDPANGRPYYKAVYDARTVSKVDLGGHVGSMLIPHDRSERLPTRLGILHLHERCIESEVSNCRKALISHGYITEADSESVALRKLQAWTGEDPCALQSTKDFHKTGPSQHKVLFYAKYVACRNETLSAFYRGEGGKVNSEFVRYRRAVAEKYGVLE